MDPLVLGGLVAVITVLVLFSGMSVAIGLLVVSGGFLIVFDGMRSLELMPEILFGKLDNFALLAIPMFIIMGASIASTRAGADLYEALERWMTRVPGGLVISNLGACALFSAMSGSSPATCAAIGKMGIPEMRRRGYPDGIAAGSIAAGGTLGILIPPSVTMIVYGIATETSIGKLFLAGVFPGLLLVGLFMAWSLYATWRSGDAAVLSPSVYTMRQRLEILPRVLPFLAIIVGVLYAMYGGIATPSETAAVGALLCLLIAMVIYRLWSPAALWTVLRDSTRESVMILFIIAAAGVFSYMLSSLFITQSIAAWIGTLEVNRWVLMGAVNVFLLIAGFFLPPVAVILMAAPILLPIITTAGFDPIWFAVILTINMEIGLISPPVGLNLYVINGIAPDIPLKTILSGSLPFVACMVVAIVIICVFPGIATWLPDRVIGGVSGGGPLWEGLLTPHEGSSAPFLIAPDGGTTSYGAFLDRAARIAGALASLGLEPGDRLAAQISKCADAIALYAACVARGVVLLPLNTAYTPAELDYFVRDAGAAMLVCDPADVAALRPLAEGAGAKLETLGEGGAGTLPAMADGADPAPPVRREEGDLAAFLYTSGTTGRSKGAMLTQGNLLSNARTLASHWRFTERDVLLHALPIFHTHGLFVAINVTLAAGASMVLFPDFDAPAMVAAMPRATAMMGVPTFYTRLLAEPGLGAAARGMRLFVSGSAPLLPETHTAWEAATGHRILERYGMTETNMNTSNPYEGERRAGTVGLPLPGVELRVCAPGTADPVPSGETGVIEVRGPNVFRGYWNMPEKTAAELRPDGWFVTGDLGRVDADGYLSIVGRDKDLIISGGYNVYPREVEEVIDAQPGVAESAVVGAPHPDLGEGVVAVVVPEGAGPDMGALEDAVAAVLARYKRPRAWASAAALPRNAMGKVQKAELRRAHAGTFGAGAT